MPEYELKFVVPNFKLTPLISFIRAVCASDGEHATGIVSSIYYDTRSADALAEKINSDYLKTKIRLRWYRDPVNGEFSSTSFCECKHRIGGHRVKARVSSDLRPEELDRMRLDDPKLLAVPLELRKNGVSIREHMFPMLRITYTRSRFVEPASGARVSIDADICAPRFNPHMLPSSTPCALTNAVIEVKGDSTTLPASLAAITRFGARKASFSKYLACCAKSMHTEFLPL